MGSKKLIIHKSIEILSCNNNMSDKISFAELGPDYTGVVNVYDNININAIDLCSVATKKIRNAASHDLTRWEGQKPSFVLTHTFPEVFQANTRFPVKFFTFANAITFIGGLAKKGCVKKEKAGEMIDILKRNPAYVEVN